MNCVFRFSLQTMSETFIVRNVEQDVTINEHRCSCKVPVTLKQSLKFNFLNRHLKNSQILTFKIRGH
jgi:hypothetical protein